jgi:hypothetical protein
MDGPKLNWLAVIAKNEYCRCGAISAPLDEITPRTFYTRIKYHVFISFVRRCTFVRAKQATMFEDNIAETKTERIKESIVI